jgi:hypothetical protein
MKQLFLIVIFLSLLFCSPLPNRPVHIFMIDDSTMADKDPKAEPERGWRQALQVFLTTMLLENSGDEK